MSQSRFSIVLVGVSALLRRPLVSRLRPADGERSPWVVFAARGGRFDSGFRWAGWPSGSLLPLFGTHRFGDSVRRVGSSAFRFGVALGGLVFGLIASAFRHAPIRGGRWASSFFRLPLRKLPSAGWPSGSPLPLFGMHRFGVALGGLAFGLTASDFRHAPIRSGRWAVGLRAHCFRFSACAVSEWPLGEFVLPPSASEWPLGGLAFGLLLPLFGMHRFGVALGGLLLPPSASEILFGGLVLPLGGWPSGSLLPLFGMHRFGVALGGLVLLPPASEIAARRVGLRTHGFRFSACAASGLPSASWPSGLRLPLFGTHRFGVATGRVRSSAFRFGDCPRRVGLRAHRFRFSARTASGLPSAG